MICKACYEAAYLSNEIRDIAEDFVEDDITVIARITLHKMTEHLDEYHCTCPPREGVENGKRD